MFKKRIIIMAICLLCITLCCTAALSVSAVESNSYSVTLGSQIISNGKVLFYETISPALIDNPYAADYYPGELTVHISGPIVIEDGGNLTIGTLSLRNPDEAGPVIRGELAENGLIIVKSGGTLNLKTVTLDTTGEGLLIFQEPGGSVNLTDSQIDADLIHWAPPQVENTYQKPRDLFLPEGTLLTADMLPTEMNTFLQYQGVDRWSKIAMSWDLDSYNGQTEGELALTGVFQDEDGNIMASVQPLTITVHWYEPDTIVITDATWANNLQTLSAILTAEKPPEYVDNIWGEVSNDGGKTWERWDNLIIMDNEGFWTCIFYMPDNVPRHLRIAASADTNEFKHWISKGVFPTNNIDNQSGNRGGSTSPNSPDRPPQPADSPNTGNSENSGDAINSGAIINNKTSVNSTASTESDPHSVTQKEPVTEAPETSSGEQTAPAIKSGADTAEVPDNLDTAVNESSPNSSTKQLHPILQTILVLCGLCVCIGAAVAVSIIISRRRK